MSLLTVLSLAYALVVNPSATQAIQDLSRIVSQPQRWEELEEKVLTTLHSPTIYINPRVIYISRIRLEKPQEVWPNNSTLVPDCTYISAVSSNRYAQPELVDMLISAAREMYEKCSVHGTGPRLEIHDASRKYGGRLYPHLSHRRGIDVDVGMYWFKEGKYGNSSGVIKKWNRETLEANWDFIKSIQYHYAVESVFWSGRYINQMHDYVLTNYGPEEWNQYGKVLQRESYHTRHFHIRVKNPSVLKKKMVNPHKPCC